MTRDSQSTIRFVQNDHRQNFITGSHQVEVHHFEIIAGHSDFGSVIAEGGRVGIHFEAFFCGDG